MVDLNARHEALLESHHGALSQAAERLLEATSWSLATPALMLRTAVPAASQVVAVGDLGRWIPHLGPDLDAFVRLRRQGVDVGEAYARCRATDGEAFLGAWGSLRGERPLVSHDDLNQFAVLSQQGFSRSPRNLLVVVNWGERVTAFLVACERQRRRTPPVGPD
ncbi:MULTISPECIES: hypothetical protein [Cyanophyceae]|uniref:Uncharacterized protein n=1 Tax=Aphanothece cf. minutissima CCALA 015 TaxID=2107695 RepID=A0ABX5F8S0_9CHRO|nr:MULTISPECIES: hypothetical protein [Cyanophyceae]MCP9797940.1 hypothetical protein [Cyanobium sp. Lug-B]PSB38128.1 hypothetical protein C7B81_05320 [Aphanothece cf. minutissima CCALA 015]